MCCMSSKASHALASEKPAFESFSRGGDEFASDLPKATRGVSPKQPIPVQSLAYEDRVS